MTSEVEAASPLAGLNVVECATGVGVRYCGRLLSSLGATVVRAGGPEAGSKAPTAFDAWLDEGKAKARDLDDALAIVGATPDLVLAGQTPAEVRAVDADLARASLDSVRLGLTWFGMGGPYADWRGDDALVQALVGIAAGFGDAEGPPMLPQGVAPQIVAGATLFFSGLAVLWGGGVRQVDVDVLEAALCFSEISPAGFEKSGGSSVRTGVNRFAANHPMSVYRTRDGWIGVTALTPAQWQALAALLGRPDLASDPRFVNSVGRVAHADLIDPVLRDAFLARDTQSWLIEGQGRRIPMAPVPRPVELIATPHWRQRDAFAPIQGFPGVEGPRPPFRVRSEGRDGGGAAHGGGGPLPLSGLRVVDFSMGWAGPLCARHLADLGAEVIKVESATHYDWWRGWEPPGASDPPEYELKPVFNVMNRGKRGVLIDLTTAEGAAQAKALVATADIVIENYAPGVMAKLGLDYEVLRQVRPGLVMVSMGAFGATGPWSHFRAYGATVEQASGMPHVNGLAEWPPCLQHGAYGDPVAGVFAAVAAMAGLHGRARLGGCWADLAQVQCLFQLGAEAIIASQLAGEPPRLGSRSPSAAPRCVSPAREGYVAVVAPDEAAWLSLCGVLGRPDWKDDPDFSSVEGRNARAETIEAALAAWTSGQAPEAAAEQLQSAGAAAAPVVATDGLATQSHLVARGVWTRLDRRFSGSELMAAPPYRLDGERPALARPAPLLGEHTEDVLASISAKELAP